MRCSGISILIVRIGLFGLARRRMLSWGEGASFFGFGCRVWVYIDTWVVWFLEPGRLADKDRGLWTLRREFESRPGYHFLVVRLA